MRSKKLNLLINPFLKIAGWEAFFFGTIISGLIIFIGYTNNLFFPGIISIRNSSALTFSNAVVFQVIGLLPAILLMYLSGLVFSKNVRFQDILGSVTLARFPYILMVLFGFLLNNNSSRLLGTHEYLILGIFTIIYIILSIWIIVLLYNAFKVSTNIKGNKGIIIFASIVIISEFVINILPPLF